MLKKSKNGTYNGFKKSTHNYKYGKKRIREIYNNIVINVC